MRSTMRALLALTLCATADLAGAQTVYKCTADGKVTYTETPCPNGSGTALAPPAAPSQPPESAAAELARQQRLSKELERDRHRAEAKDGREMERVARAADARQAKCNKLKLNKKWADDDLKGASAGRAESAQRKARHAAEQLKLGCPG
ncbi:DUF4124 domain-containing protein [Rugamonas sp. CCM 8940]|uniref:DUF4124 domain-containing protein n=1 Tax=Rugamonas sp. CCM 8940 TaxID=2765359 RepID=UPI0018F5847D|nr:DUF4124 domain-containing protein [Rugamonas sp. CCM 8940]MBJ7310515.1 DUF4124 domain-containing protein [Rugamonas sp. CCM 8940]